MKNNENSITGLVETFYEFSMSFKCLCMHKSFTWDINAIYQIAHHEQTLYEMVGSVHCSITTLVLCIAK
jgi:hypothetical protein